MRGNPVHDDSDPVLVAEVNQIAQIIRSTESTGGSKVPGNLVSPGRIKCMFGERKNLDEVESV